jgi:hypothetical protein
VAWANAHGDTVFQAGKNNGNSFGNTKTLSNGNDPSINPQVSPLGKAVRGCCSEGSSNGPYYVSSRAGSSKGDSF